MISQVGAPTAVEKVHSATEHLSGVGGAMARFENFT